MARDRGAETVERPPWFARLWQRYRPTTGWAIFWLSLSGVLLLPLALVSGELIPGVDPAISLSILAFVFTWWLAHRRISGPAAAAVVFAAGVVADLLWGVFVLRPAPLVGQVAAWWRWFDTGRRAPEPAITYFQEQAAILGGYLQRVAWWVKGLVAGPGAPDNLAVIGLIVLLAWLIAGWAAWWIARRGQPLVALLPAAVFLAQHAFWVRSTISFVLVFLGIATFLLVLSNLVFNMKAWDEAGVDYAEDLRLDFLLTGLALVMVVTLASPTLPFFASGEFSQRFWSLFESPWRKVEQQVSASFQLSGPVRSFVPPSGAAPGGLPRAHLLSAGPELRREIALRVGVRGDPSNLQLYWRGQTYDLYTGRGWESTPEHPTAMRLDAGRPWDAGLPSTEGRRPVVASMEVVKASREVIYAAGEPVGIDRPYTAIVRAPGDLVALTSPRGAVSYTALSYVPEQNTAVLRAAGGVYPSDVISRYLQLPPDLDPRLRDAARRWTSGQATAFDKAAAIERELRAIPYSLDVPTPPPGRELVSWFLFDLKRGYCDYYASAMILLARLNGIPARLAIGYATGTLDRATGQYVVSEAQAHSWPEVYFPGIGWVPFEPTAALPQPARLSAAEPLPPAAGFERGPEDLAHGMAEIRQSAAVNTAVDRREAVGRGAVSVTLALLLLWALWLTRANSQPVPSASGEAVEAFERLAAWGGRLGQPPAAGDTPREYAREVGRAADQVAGRARWRRTEVKVAAQDVTTGARQLSEVVERSLFAPPAAVNKQPAAWGRLWRALRELWLAKILGRSS